MSHVPSFKDIEYTVDNNIATIAINRPQVYNALTKHSKSELLQAFKISNRDREVKVIILTGTGNAFTTGQDLNHRSVSSEADLGDTLTNEWNPLIKNMRSSSKIIIGAINGVVAGAGLSVALACDLLTAAPHVKFISGFSKLGLTCDAGATYTLTKALGTHRALEFFLTNDPLSSEKLQTLGIIAVVEEDFLAAATKLAEKIKSVGPLAVEMIKKNIQKSWDTTYLESMEQETAGQRFLGKTQDYREGLNAFFEKRPANFKGA